MQTFSEVLLENASATSAEKFWPGGRGVFMVGATWGGATIALQVKLPGGAFVDVGTDTTLTANGLGGFDLPPCTIKATVTGGPPSAVYATVARVPA